MESHQNVGRLTRDLKALKYPNLDVFSVKDGDPIVFLQILQFLLDSFNHSAGFFGKSDEQFINKVYLLLRDKFNYKPKLSQVQFFKPGFVNAKCELAIDLMQMLKDEKKSSNTSSKEKLNIVPQEKPVTPELTANDSLLQDNIPAANVSILRKIATDEQKAPGFGSRQVSVVSEEDKILNTNSIGQDPPPGFLFSFAELKGIGAPKPQAVAINDDGIFNTENQNIFTSDFSRNRSTATDESLKDKQRFVDAVISSKPKFDPDRSVSWSSSGSDFHLQKHFQGYRDTEKQRTSSASISEEDKVELISVGASEYSSKKKANITVTPPPQPNGITITKDSTPKQKSPLRLSKQQLQQPPLISEYTVQSQLELVMNKLDVMESKIDQYNMNQSKIMQVGYVK